MSITAAQVKELRDKTGAGMMECKKALVEVDGDAEKAVKFLRERGLAAAAKKASRATTEGIIGQYIHAGGKLGVLVEVNCETDFVARTEEFQEMVKNVAMQIAAANPRYVTRDGVNSSDLDKEREILRNQALQSGKPEQVIDKIVEGRINKFFSEVCLYEQPYVKNSDQSVEDYVKSAIAQLGENISVRRFIRFKVGEE